MTVVRRRTAVIGGNVSQSDDRAQRWTPGRKSFQPEGGMLQMRTVYYDAGCAAPPFSPTQRRGDQLIAGFC